MRKIHYNHCAVDARDSGLGPQTEYEYQNQTACGYVRENVTRNGDLVTCKLCLNSIHMVHYHTINKTMTDSSGCY